MIIPCLMALAVAIGLALDSIGTMPAQYAADGVVVALWAAMLAAAEPRERRIALVCMAWATLGELLLAFGLGLYEYRHGNLPLFVPLGHSMLFLAGLRIAPRLPALASPAIVAVSAVAVAWRVAHGVDTLALPLYPLFLCCWGCGFAARSATSRQALATMLALAWLVELAGTGTGAWRWTPVLSWIPGAALTATNPPLAAGAFYCVLDVLVLACLGGRRVAGGRVVESGAGTVRETGNEVSPSTHPTARRITE